MSKRFFGWKHDPQAVEAYLAKLDKPTFTMAAPDLLGAEHQDVLHWEQGELALYKRLLPAHEQEIGDCFAAGTMIAGDYTRPIEEVNVGDVVWTAEGKLTRVITTMQKVVDRPLFKIKAKGALPLTVTGEHKVWAIRSRKICDRAVTPMAMAAAEADGNWRGRSYNAVRDCYESMKPEWVKAEDLEAGDYLLLPSDAETAQRPESPIVDDDADWLFGLFMGDGWTNGMALLSIGWSISDRDIELRLTSILDRCGLKWSRKSERSTDKAWRIIVNSRELATWFREQFYDDSTKRWPAWLVGSELALEGLYDADGHESSERRVICSTSPSLIHGASLTLAKLGFAPARGVVTRSAGAFPNAKPLLSVNWKPTEREKQYIYRWGKYVAYPIRSVNVIEGPHVVYDVGVADAHHSLIANGVAAKNCVSHGWGRGIQDQLFIDIAQRRDPENPKTSASGSGLEYAGGKVFWNGHQVAGEDEVIEIATEPTYALSRVEIGRGQIGRGDGSVGAWAAQATLKYGSLARKKYASIDLSRYRPDIAKAWGMPGAGLPNDLEPEARLHVCKYAALVETGDEARAALYNLLSIPVCSQQGFTMVRDSRGMCRPQGSWAHCMLVRGICMLKGGILVVIIQQSWGENPTGPDVITLEKDGREVKLPQGCFAVDFEVFERRMLSVRDSFAVSGPLGYVRRRPLAWNVFDLGA